MQRVTCWRAMFDLFDELRLQIGLRQRVRGVEVSVGQLAQLGVERQFHAFAIRVHPATGEFDFREIDLIEWNKVLF